MAWYPGLQIKLSSLIPYKKEQIESIMFVSPAANTKDLGTAQIRIYTHTYVGMFLQKKEKLGKKQNSANEEKSKWN